MALHLLVYSPGGLNLQLEKKESELTCLLKKPLQGSNKIMYVKVSYKLQMIKKEHLLHYPFKTPLNGGAFVHTANKTASFLWFASLESK